MTAPIPRHVGGEQIRIALMAAKPAGLHTNDLMAATGLTRSQVANGIIWIRLVAAAEHLTPLTYDRKGGYRFSDDPMDWASYALSRAHIWLTSCRRTLKGTVDPHGARLPADAFARMLSDNVSAMCTSLEFVTTQTYRPPAA